LPSAQKSACYRSNSGLFGGIPNASSDVYVKKVEVGFFIIYILKSKNQLPLKNQPVTGQILEKSGFSESLVEIWWRFGP